MARFVSGTAPTYANPGCSYHLSCHVGPVPKWPGCDPDSKRPRVIISAYENYHSCMAFHIINSQPFGESLWLCHAACGRGELFGKPHRPASTLNILNRESAHEGLGCSVRLDSMFDMNELESIDDTSLLSTRRRSLNMDERCAKWKVYELDSIYEQDDSGI